jgi:hypothetical protein
MTLTQLVATLIMVALLVVAYWSENAERRVATQNLAMLVLWFMVMTK